MAVSLAGFLLAALTVAENPVLRGVPPANVAKYQGDRFTCFDGGLTIPIGMVNDDYCDCNDGSDEPGTSACKRGSYFCVNKGYQSLQLPSSRVNDGICDCCDGSDEWQNKVKCNNNCAELGRESLKDLVAEVERYEAGVAKLQSLISSGQNLKADKDRALSEANQQVTELEAALKELEEKKNAEEALEKEEQVKRAPPPEETPDAPSAESASSPEPAKEAEKEKEEEKFPYPKEYQYKAEEKKPEEEAEKFPYPKEYAYKGEEKASETETTHDNHEDAEDNEAELEPDNAPDTTSSTPSVEKYVSPAAEAARIAFREKETQARNARETRDRLQRELSNDFGTQGEFMSLLGSCFDVQVRQYTYEACPYGSAAQKEGSSSTSLGNWVGFEKKENGRLSMKFAGGQRCWQGPERSFDVDVHCGVDNVLYNVDEPSKCVYTAKLVTPAACNEGQAKALREHLNGLLAAQA